MRAEFILEQRLRLLCQSVYTQNLISAGYFRLMASALGLDFGTTNTVLATCDGQSGLATPVEFQFGDESIDSLRSALSFWKPDVPQPNLSVDVGPWAIQHYIEDPAECRFLQSLKSFAASPHFQNTYLYAKKYRFEDLLEAFFKCTLNHAGDTLKPVPERLVIGRPVTFAGASADPKLAMDRYRTALSSFGFSEILFVYEPVAAAFFFASKLKKNAKILVADFGGGTTDYSIMQFDVSNGAFSATPLGHGGIGLAGDTFDFRIIHNVILPHLGRGTSYRSLGKILDLPQSVFSRFGRWNQLSLLKMSDEFRELKQMLKSCVEPDKIQRFIDVVEDNQGYPLYRAVSAAKARLSTPEETELTFAPLGTDFKTTIRREDFDLWIADDLARMEEALSETLVNAGLEDGAIDKVFLTGGTSFVPAVRKLFERRFGANKIESGDELLSIANGLALIGERADAKIWAVEA